MLVPVTDSLTRNVSATLEAQLSGRSRVELQVALAGRSGLDVDERLSVLLDGRPFEPCEVVTDHGTRVHVLDEVEGRLSVSYRATAVGRAEPLPLTEQDVVTYTRPSRYAESDRLLGFAKKQFGSTGNDLLHDVASWVGSRLSYVPGSSGPTDGATDTLMTGAGVCRDYAHLVIALLRALDVPARLVSVYAPGLSPMDFHAVAEANLDGQWYVVDATTLAPRTSLVRIATGRDASDTAFLNVHHGYADLDELEVSAVADVLPDDDVRDLVTIG